MFMFSMNSNPVTIHYWSYMDRVPVLLVEIGCQRFGSIGLTSNELWSLINKYPEVFKDELGTMVNFKATLNLKPTARPKFFQPRAVPFALRDSIEAELACLDDTHIISKVSHSDWAAPIVAVPKKDGKLRLCGDYKVTINPILEVDQYPLPKSDDLFATLSGGKISPK